MPRSPAKLHILLGPDHQRYLPQAPEGAELLGVVERGMQIGALARLADGSFVQINGDVVQPLNRSQVEAALRAARPARPHGRFKASSAPVAPPVVTIKRRRVFTPV